MTGKTESNKTLRFFPTSRGKRHTKSSDQHRKQVVSRTAVPEPTACKLAERLRGRDHLTAAGTTGMIPPTVVVDVVVVVVVVVVGTV